MYLKNKTAAVEGVCVGGRWWSVLYPRKDSQNGFCFLVNTASDRKLHTAEKRWAQATSPPTAPRPESLTATHFCLGFGIQVAHAGFLENPGARFNGREFVLFQELTKEVLKLQCSLLTSFLSVSCTVRKSNPIVKGSDTNTSWLGPGK